MKDLVNITLSRIINNYIASKAAIKYMQISTFSQDNLSRSIPQKKYILWSRLVFHIFHQGQSLCCKANCL